MYATATHVHNGSNIPHYNVHHSNVHPLPQNVSHQPHPSPVHPPSQRSTSSIPKEPIIVVGIPSVSIQNNRLVVGSQSSSTRSYTPLKVLGDGSFGTVWLCDWHGTLPPNTPLSPMQCGAGARPEWAGKRLVAVKRMKKKWEGGWEECQKLKELESLRAIPFHPNIIPLYDFFLLPATKELYFVFESMEGNLYHLIKARKGRPLAGGLISSIFHQIVSGLDHIHSSGYFHRDMKPENVLVTTIGLYDYISLSPYALPNAPKERDVVAIIKLADFGLARETKSKPPYTEYVSTRWYRAPEVLLYSRDYSNPVDMWALGTIMAELVNLRPLFPGSDQIDQVARICEILGDPSDEYGVDTHQCSIGGGPWTRGIKMARTIGFQFPKIAPKDIYSLFDRNVPLSLIHCIRGLLKYDPDQRLTSRQCLEHAYLRETAPRNNPPGLRSSASNGSILSNGNTVNGSSHTLSSTSRLHASNSNSSFPDASVSHRTPFRPVMEHPSTHASAPIQGDRRMQPSVQVWEHTQTHTQDHPMDISPAIEHPPQNNKPKKFGSLKKHSKWGLGGMFGGDKTQLPTLDEVPDAVNPSLKRTQSTSTDGKSVRDSSPARERNERDLQKLNKKEAERLQREAEKQRRKLAEKMHRDQARAVMQKRNQMMQQGALGTGMEWVGGNEQRLQKQGKIASTGPVRQERNTNASFAGSSTVNAASGKFAPPSEISSPDREWRGPNERFSKIPRRDFDDDRSSSDVHSISRMSSMSFATVDSDPGPSRLRHRSSLFGMNRMTSMSSLRTSFDEFSPSARSSNSFSLEGQLAHDFRIQASVNSSHIGSVSPPPMQMLSLSPTLSPSLSPSPPWIQVQQTPESAQSPTYVGVPLVPQNGYSYDVNGHLSPHYGHSSDIEKSPESVKATINPIFKVAAPLPPQTGDSMLSQNPLPPFSQLDAVAAGEYPPLSPMSFVTAHSEDP